MLHQILVCFSEPISHPWCIPQFSEKKIFLTSWQLLGLHRYLENTRVPVLDASRYKYFSVQQDQQLWALLFSTRGFLIILIQLNFKVGTTTFQTGILITCICLYVSKKNPPNLVVYEIPNFLCIIQSSHPLQQCHPATLNLPFISYPLPFLAIPLSMMKMKSQLMTRMKLRPRRRRSPL